MLYPLVRKKTIIDGADIYTTRKNGIEKDAIRYYESLLCHLKLQHFSQEI